MTDNLDAKSHAFMKTADLPAPDREVRRDNDCY